MKQTQKERLLKYFKQHEHINPLESWLKLGIYRLSDVVFRLREEHFIDTEIVKVENQFGEKCRVAKYVYIGEKKSSL